MSERRTPPPRPPPRPPPPPRNPPPPPPWKLALPPPWKPPPPRNAAARPPPRAPTAALTRPGRGPAVRPAPALRPAVGRFRLTACRLPAVVPALVVRLRSIPWARSRTFGSFAA